MTEELLKQADDEVAVLLDASEAFDMLNIEPKTGKRLAELIKALADELRCREWRDIETIKEAGRERILVTDGVTVGSIYIESGVAYVAASNEHTSIRDATHWMYLPEPPKERD